MDNLDPTMAEAHLLMAQIQVHEGNYLSAQQNLEVGLSYNFEVRDHPIFHLINAKVQKDQGNITDAEKTLKKALELALKDIEASKKGPKNSDGKKIAFTTADLATIYLELADRYVPYLPNRTGRYKIPTPRVQIFPRAAKPQGEKFYPRGRFFIPPHPIG